MGNEYRRAAAPDFISLFCPRNRDQQTKLSHHEIRSDGQPFVSAGACFSFLPLLSLLLLAPPFCGPLFLPWVDSFQPLDSLSSCFLM